MLPLCLLDIIAHMAFSMRGRALKNQLDLCVAVHKSIPAVFIEPVVFMYGRRFREINPFRPGVPFIPLHLFQWGPQTYSRRLFNMRAVDLLLRMIDPARVRSHKTYKGILTRRVRGLEKADLSTWNVFLLDFGRLNHSVLYDITYNVLEDEWIAASELLYALKGARPLPLAASLLAESVLSPLVSPRVGAFSRSCLSSRPRSC